LRTHGSRRRSIWRVIHPASSTLWELALGVGISFFVVSFIAGNDV
jgi:hypothetical protein